MANPISNNPIFPAGSNFVISGGTFNSSTTQNSNGAKGGFERLLEAVAPNALHNSGHDFDAPKCHPGTRTAVIQTIIDWATGLHDGPERKGVAWVTGAAGAGKSAIGRSVCERCAEDGTLLASFFFGASDSTRNHSSLLASTLVYQVCCLIPAVRQVVTTIINNDPLILTHTLREQLSTLLITPLLSAFSNDTTKAPHLVVIDGLDECNSHKGQLEILDSLLYLSTMSDFPIRFLVCSRPESQIVNFFSSPHSQGILFKIYLGDEYSPDQDIAIYLYDRFKAIKQGHIHRSLIPDTWPEEHHVSELVRNSSGQFIYASTVVSYVESPRHCPHQRLESVLGLRPPFKDLPFSQLDSLYAHILQTTDEPQLVVDILAIPAFTHAVHASDAEQILMLEPGDIQIQLADCASIVNVDSDPMSKIFLLHKSFSDFLRDPHRSKDFHRNYADTVAKHLLRIIEIFLEQHTWHKNLSWSETLAELLNFISIPDEAWSTSAYQPILNAITQFPMEQFCKTYFSHNLSTGEGYFLFQFLNLLLNLSTNPTIYEAYEHHIMSLCQCVLDEINGKYKGDIKGNYALAFFYLKASYRRVKFDEGDNNFYYLLVCLSQSSYAVYSSLLNAFQRLITPTIESQILAKAAVYCFIDISNYNFKLRKEPEGLIYIRGISRKIRQRRPWHWHRTFRSRLRTDQLCVTSIWTPLHLTSLKKEATIAKKNINNREFSISSIFSANLESKLPRTHSTIPYEYMATLEYFVRILPHAGPYTLLITMCRTKTLSQFSTFFPDLSRRARLAIADYLERAELALGDGDLEAK